MSGNGRGELVFTKHEGAGNDFLVLVDLERRHPITSDQVRALCDRHRGVGADGLIRVSAAAAAAAATGAKAAALAGGCGAELVMELWNADGSVAAMSGNGMRCLAQAAVEAGVVRGHRFTVSTRAGPRRVTYRPPGTASGTDPGTGTASGTAPDPGTASGTTSAPAPTRARPPTPAPPPTPTMPSPTPTTTTTPPSPPDPTTSPASTRTASASVDMGPVRLGHDQPQRFSDRRVREVFAGNPHIVLWGPDDPAGVAVEEIGPRIAAGFPDGVNVEFVSAGSRPGELILRVWERGVGETLACGTGSCAAAAAARSWGLVGDLVHVRNPGGTLQVELGRTPDEPVVLSGPVRKVATVTVDLEAMQGGPPVTAP